MAEDKPKTKSRKTKLLTGMVQATRTGAGFLISPDAQTDVYLPPEEMRKVLPGDEVQVRPLSPDMRGRVSGEIVALVARAKNTVVGQFVPDRKIGAHVYPEDSRIGFSVMLDPNDPLKAKKGDVVLVAIDTEGLFKGQPKGHLLEILGKSGDPGLEIEIAVRKFDVPHEFSAETLKEVQAFSTCVTKEDLKHRIDLRDIPFVTIDGEDARDFDDAVYCRKNKRTGAWRLLVAIADVSHYVKPGSAIDKDAQLRATSVYFPRRVIPMLPEELSNGLCSLVPNQDRCAMVCDAVIAPDGAVKAYQFYPAVICSAARLTYNQVWAAISNPTGPEAASISEVFGDVQNLHELFGVLNASRSRRGAMDFETIETYIQADENGRIEKILPRVRNDAHRLIEECMLVANTCAADFLQRTGAVSLYRVHEPPSLEKLKKVRALLRPLGLELGGGDKPAPADYCKLLEQIQGRVDKTMLQTVLLRSMQQAVYTPHNAGHFGLAYPAYTHFTSPIRRYPDLLLHRTIAAVLTGKRYQPKVLVGPAADGSEDEMRAWERLGEICSACERRADEASFDVLSWLKCWYMTQFIGQVFEGTISGVSSSMVFVTLNDMYVDGGVHVSNLGYDYYLYDEQRSRFVGEVSGQTFGLGDPVTVQVEDVDVDTRRIEFEILDHQQLQRIRRAQEKAARRAAAKKQNG